MKRPANQPPYRPANDGYPYKWPQPAGAMTYRLNGTQVGRGNILDIAGAGITATPLDDGITYNITGGGGGGVTQLIGGTGISVNNGGVGIVTVTNTASVSSGTYNPVAAGVANVTFVFATQAQYMQVGSVVTVSGAFTVTNTAGGVFILNLSLPINSAFVGNGQQVCGVGATIDLSSEINMQSTNNATFTSTRLIFGGPVLYYYTYTYEIV